MGGKAYLIGLNSGIPNVSRCFLCYGGGAVTDGHRKDGTGGGKGCLKH